MAYSKSVGLATVLAFLPLAAFAHVGDHTAASFTTGFSHPLWGPDHVLAMLAVGLWAAISGGRAGWAMPVTFVAALVTGGAIGMAEPTLSFAEPMILASIVFLGLVVAFALRPPLGLALIGIAVFGLAHGYVHGAEAPHAGSDVAITMTLALYAAGFALASALLHGAGLAIGQVLNGRLARIMGAATAAAGVALALA